jgi:hypothetical protein
MIIFTSIAGAFAQSAGPPRKLKAKGVYTHAATGTVFNEKIGDYARAGVYAFDRKANHIGATYENRNPSGLTTLSVYLYPAGGSEERLRMEYVHSLRQVANASPGSGVAARQYPAVFKDGNYKVNGYTAQIEEPQSLLTLLECGQWFFKIRISTNHLDSAGVKALEKEVVTLFKPTELVKKAPMKWEATIHFAPAAFRDSVMLGSVMGSAYKKMDWAKRHVDSLERAGGFPDLYLDLHVAALKEFIQFEKRESMAKTRKQPATKQYLAELNQIIEAGFLEEFIMEEYDMIMIVPEDMTLDFDAYADWKVSHPTAIDLKQKYTVISFGEK